MRSMPEGRSISLEEFSFRPEERNEVLRRLISFFYLFQISFKPCCKRFEAFEYMY